jgi:exopolyphosphatase/guanosine-5'-triphosphate,3'-diphosphate pyrophosphatase
MRGYKMRYAIVDLGSNTMRMSVYDYIEDNCTRILSEKEIAGIVGYVENHCLNKDGIYKIITALKGFLKTANAVNVDRFCCFATASLRNIDNTIEVIEKIKSETGLSVEVISGEEEAKLDFYGAYSSCGLEQGLMVDMGGGSTELILFKGASIALAVSLPFGSLYLYKKFVKNIIPDKKEIKEIRMYVKRHINEVLWLKNCTENICAIGGTARAIARLHMEYFKIMPQSGKDYKYNSGDFIKLQAFIEQNPDVAKDMIIKTAPERIHTILPGMVGFSSIIKCARSKSITVSYNGVREGYLNQRVLNKI